MANSPFSLSGQVILLTGGAGLYGRGLSAQLAETGATLVLASRNVEALRVVAAEETAKGHTVHARELDQGDEASVLRLRDSMLADFGHIDGLVNNAVSRPMKSTQGPLADWEASMRTNATGLFSITRTFGEAMASRGSGKIVNIGSIQGMVGPDFSLYEGTAMAARPYSRSASSCRAGVSAR
jgi:NAD(P)-dependent dehydrogenase (short-subunit alcohol dehydrogenase family)